MAQNTCKNKHLRELYCDENGNGVPDSQEGEDDGESDPTDPVQEEIVQLGSQGEQLFYYHSDHLGSTGYVTRENGEVHEHIQYFPFGETWVQQGGNTEKSPYLFTSKELDEETGLYYFGSRYYDPRTSVWQSADPILGRYLDGSPSGGVYTASNLNLYHYSAQNPVRFKDDDGEFVNFIVGAAVGFVADVGFQVAVQVATGQDIDIDWSEAAGSAALGATGVGAVSVAAKGMKALKAAKKVKKEVEALKRIGEKQRTIRERASVKIKSRNPNKGSKVEPSEKVEDIGGVFTKKTKTTPGNKPGQSRSEMEFVKNKDGRLIRSRKFSYDRGNKFQQKKTSARRA